MKVKFKVTRDVSKCFYVVVWFKCSSVFVRTPFRLWGSDVICGGLLYMHECMNFRFKWQSRYWRTPETTPSPTHRFSSLSRELLLIKLEVQGPWWAWAACLWPCVWSVSFYECSQVWLRLSFSVIALTNMFALHVVVERHAVRDSAGPLGTPDRGHIKKWRKQASFVPLNTWTWCFYVHVVT